MADDPDITARTPIDRPGAAGSGAGITADRRDGATGPGGGNGSGAGGGAGSRRQRYRARRRRLVRSPAARRRAGRIMVATAIIGMVVVLAGVAVAWKLIGDINQATQETLDVTIESLDSLEATVDLADELIGSTSESLGSVESTLGSVSDSFSTGSATISDIGDLTDTAEPALRDAEGTLRDLETIGGQLDGALSGLSALPLGFDYHPDAGLGDTFGQLADNLEPLPDQFADTSTSLDEFEVSLDQLQTDVESLESDVSALNEDLAESEELITTYRENVDNAQAVAQRSRQDLDQDETLLRLVLVVAGLNFAVAQIVPLWVGWELQDEDAEGAIDLYDNSPAGPV